MPRLAAALLAIASCSVAIAGTAFAAAPCPIDHDQLVKVYGEQGVVSGLGVSGDSFCADHNIAWHIRHGLGLDRVPAGVSPGNNDAIIYDILPDKTSASGYGHARCKGSDPQIAEQIQAGSVPPWAKAMK
jgi:hypothetical protein